MEENARRFELVEESRKRCEERIQTAQAAAEAKKQEALDRVCALEQWERELDKEAADTLNERLEGTLSLINLMLLAEEIQFKKEVLQKAHNPGGKYELAPKLKEIDYDIAVFEAKVRREHMEYQNLLARGEFATEIPPPTSPRGGPQHAREESPFDIAAILADALHSREAFREQFCPGLVDPSRIQTTGSRDLEMPESQPPKSEGKPRRPMKRNFAATATTGSDADDEGFDEPEDNGDNVKRARRRVRRDETSKSYPASEAGKTSTAEWVWQAPKIDFDKVYQDGRPDPQRMYQIVNFPPPEDKAPSWRGVPGAAMAMRPWYYILRCRKHDKHFDGPGTKTAWKAAAAHVATVCHKKEQTYWNAIKEFGECVVNCDASKQRLNNDAVAKASKLSRQSASCEPSPEDNGLDTSIDNGGFSGPIGKKDHTEEPGNPDSDFRPDESENENFHRPTGRTLRSDAAALIEEADSSSPDDSMELGSDPGTREETLQQLSKQLDIPLSSRASTAGPKQQTPAQRVAIQLPSLR